MGMSARRSWRSVLAGFTAAVAAVGLAGCGTGDGEQPADEGNNDGKITLVVDIFADQGFGYDDLVEKYMDENPNIIVQQRGIGLGLGDYNLRLTEWMSSGQGAGDIVALEEGTIVQFKAQADNFVNLLDHGAGELEDNFLPWKWEQGMTADGKLIGLGTDVGSMAVCYRKDLFAAADLPTDRDEVSKLWPTWDDFIEVGKDYTDRVDGSRFVDAATNVFNTVLLQVAGAGTGYTYFDQRGRFVLATNPDVKDAWDITVEMIQADLAAGLQVNSSQWSTGIRRGQFATVGCPSWMTGVIQGNGGGRMAGKWDIAKAPAGGGNWGGSFLAVPKQSKHQEEAVKLAKFLTSPEAHIEAFNAVGALPSSIKALDDPAVRGKRNEYFSNAPTGEIFASGVKELKPIYLGARNQAVRDAVENALRSIEQGRATPAEAWRAALKNGAAAAK
jgi:cellobiose transport system substrate-binding protein